MQPTSASSPPDPAPDPTVIHALEVEQRHESGANWFYWIAALSLVNSVILLTHGEWTFIVGLGVTQIVDTFAVVIADEGGGTLVKAVALALDVLVASVFVTFGIFARKGHAAAFIVGMVLYALDGLIFLVVADWLSFGFHLFALWGLFNGLKACQQLSPRTQVAQAASQPVGTG